MEQGFILVHGVYVDYSYTLGTNVCLDVGFQSDMVICKRRNGHLSKRRN